MVGWKRRMSPQDRVKTSMKHRIFWGGKVSEIIIQAAIMFEFQHWLTVKYENQLYNFFFVLPQL